MGRLLASFLREMATHLPHLTAAEAAGLSDATVALLRATLAASADNLDAARRHAEPMRRRQIQRIAESVGFHDASVFSRAFRCRYGVAPREVREAAELGLPSAALAPHTATSGFPSMLSRLDT